MANKSGGGISKVVWDLVKPTVEELGYILWDVDYYKEAADYCLCVTIDSEKGISIDDCEKVHRAIDPLLDEADPIENSYNLEVSSPGLERRLKTKEQMEYCRGWDVEIRLYAPDADGKKKYVGVLGDIGSDGTIHLEIDGETKAFAPEQVAALTTIFVM
ncbi:MAG: ribosome maturation factor RimP [Clostridia bacterium]|nr:ribosome maturation factor RimP [Clostridia bacterium]